LTFSRRNRNAPTKEFEAVDDDLIAADLALAGFDDLPWHRHHNPRLKVTVIIAIVHVWNNKRVSVFILRKTYLSIKGFV